MKIRYFVLILSLVILPLLIISGDEEIARALIKKGDESFQKNEISKAIELYKKALKEYSNFPEAYLKLGNAYIKTGDKRNARRNLETCIKLVKESSNPSATLQNIQKEANNKLSSLDKNRQEFITLEKKYIEQLLTFAKRNSKKDISLTESIVKIILSLDPSNSEASKLMQDLKRSRVFESWQSVFNGENLIDWSAQDPALWKTENNIIACDTTDAQTNFRTKLNLDKVYKLLIEFKVDETYNQETGGLGIIIGNKGNADITVVSVFSDRIEVLEFKQNQKGACVKREQLPEKFKISDWNTLILDVAYTGLRCYMNNQFALEHKAEQEDFFWGRTGIWMQRAKIQIKRMQCLKD